MNTNNKIIANRTIKCFSINFGKFYYEGQRIDFTDKRKKVFVNALIRNINENANTLTIVHNGKTFLQKLSSIRTISDASITSPTPVETQTVSSSSDDNAYMFKTINGISLDLYDWYFEGEKVILITENDDIYNGLIIRSINNINTITLGDTKGKTIVIDTEDIKKIERPEGYNDGQNYYKMLICNCS